MLPEQLVIFDLETTDIAESAALSKPVEIIEVGAIKLGSNFDILGEFSTLVRPINLDLVTEAVSKLTGLTTSDLDTAPFFTDVWRNFAKFTGFSSFRISSYSTFDVTVLESEYASRGLTFPHKKPTIDILSVVYGSFVSKGISVNTLSLGSVCGVLGVSRPKVHRALEDARAVGHVLKSLYTVKQSAESFTCVGV